MGYKKLRPTCGFVQLGQTEVQSSAVNIPALYSADVILPGSSSKLRLLVINLASVPGGQLVNSPTAQSLKRYRKPFGDSANIKLTDMKRTFLDNLTERQTARQTANAMKFYFLPPHIFCFLIFLAAAQVAHFVLPQPHKPTQRQNKKSHFFQRFISILILHLHNQQLTI